MVFYGVVVGCKFFFWGGIGKIEPKKAQENSFFKKEGDEHGCLLLFNYRWKTLSYIYSVEVCFGFAPVFFAAHRITSEESPHKSELQRSVFP